VSQHNRARHEWLYHVRGREQSDWWHRLRAIGKPEQVFYNNDFERALELNVQAVGNWWFREGGEPFWRKRGTISKNRYGLMIESS